MGTNEKDRQTFFTTLVCTLIWHVVKSLFEVVKILGLYVENTCRFPLNGNVNDKLYLYTVNPSAYIIK